MRRDAPSRLSLIALLVCVGAIALPCAPVSAQCVPFEEHSLGALTPFGGQRIGTSVDINADRAVVGSVQGIHILARDSESRWLASTVLTAPDTDADDLFGVAVALSPTTLVVGASLDDSYAPNGGAVYVLDFNGDAPLQFQQLSDAAPQPTAWFGRTVAVSADTIAVAAPNADTPELNAGSVSIFTRSGPLWHHHQTLTPPNPFALDAFGVSLSLEGDTLAIGAPGADLAAPNAGAVFIYTRLGSTWTLTDQLVATDAAVFDAFGQSVDLDNDSLAVGAWADDDTAQNAGAVYVFRRVGPLWIEQQKLTAQDAGVSDMLGASVAIEDDLLVAGAVRADGSAPDSGASLVFRRENAHWTQIATIPGDAPDAYAGSAVALSQGLLLTGAPFADTPETDTGAVRSFDLGALACPADVDLDCDVDVEDVITYIAAFKSELPWADTAPPETVLDFADILAFIASFTLGCP